MPEPARSISCDWRHELPGLDRLRPRRKADGSIETRLNSIRAVLLFPSLQTFVIPALGLDKFARVGFFVDLTRRT